MDVKNGWPLLLHSFSVHIRSNEAEGMTGWCWESVLCSDPEMLIRQASRSSETDDESALAAQHRAVEERLQASSNICIFSTPVSVIYCVIVMLAF